MKKIALLIFCTFQILLLLCACSDSSVESEAEPAAETEPTISKETKDRMESVIKNATEEDVSVYISEKDEALDIHVTIDPIILKYQFAIVLDPVSEAVKAELNSNGEKLHEFRLTGFFYKNGEVSDTVVWETSDFESGHFSSTQDAVHKSMTLADVFSFCEYQK